MDAYLRVTMLHLIVHGKAFDTKKNGVGETVSRFIQQEESKKDALMQCVQDSAW